MALWQYIGGIRWAFYDSKETFTEITDCAFANYGLEIIYLSKSPMYILVFETLTGNLK